MSYQRLARTVILGCSLGRRLAEPSFASARLGLAATLRQAETAAFDSKREQHTTRTLQDDMRELLAGGWLACEFSARPILRRIYSALFCFSITQPEMPYIMFASRNA